jgi:hypothetical protein
LILVYQNNLKISKNINLKLKKLKKLKKLIFLKILSKCNVDPYLNDWSSYYIIPEVPLLIINWCMSGFTVILTTRFASVAHPSVMVETSWENSRKNNTQTRRAVRTERQEG